MRTPRRALVWIWLYEHGFYRLADWWVELCVFFFLRSIDKQKRDR